MNGVVCVGECVHGQFLKPEEASYLRTYYEHVVIYILWSNVEKQILGVPKEMSHVFSNSVEKRLVTKLKIRLCI